MELIKGDRTRNGGPQFICLFLRAEHPVFPGCIDDFCAKRFHQDLLFPGKTIRDHKNHPIAPVQGSKSGSDAGVSGGHLDNRSAGVQKTSAFRVPEHIQTGAVLHGTARIPKLQLRKYMGVFRESKMVETDQRGVPDQFRHRLINCHKIISSSFLSFA